VCGSPQKISEHKVSTLATIYVQARDKKTQQIAVLTYKAFKDTAYMFDLIGQADEQGNLMDSDPNLSPQHQRKVFEKSPAAADAGDVIPSGREKLDDLLLNKWRSDHNTGSPAPLALSELSTNAKSTPPASSDGTSTSNPEMFHVEQPGHPSFEDIDGIAVKEFPENANTGDSQQPIKERKKPGPKPKNTQQ
jgi:hypothetical protein